MNVRLLGWVCAALAGSALLVYARVLGHDFVSLDDPEYVYSNPVVQQGLGWSGFAWAFSGFHFMNWHPLTWLSYMLDVELFGVDAGALLAVNAVLHAANAVLLFLALWRMTGDVWAPAAVAALFAVHPLRVESVAWVSGRKDLLSGLFAMATLLAWSAYARRPGALRYGLAVAALALGLLAKPMLVTLPLLLLLLDYWPLGRWSERGPRRLVLEKAPLLALSAASALATLWAQQGAGALKSLVGIPLAARLANAPVAYAGYLEKTLWPAGLAVFYPHPATLSARPLEGLLLPGLASAALLAALTALAWLGRRRRPWLLVGWLWYGVSLLPVIGLVQVGNQALADRYAYLPLVGIYVAAVWSVREWVGREARRARGAATATALLLAALAALTWRQVGTWRDSETLYRHALRVEPRSYLAHNNLGVLAESRGDLDGAARHFEAALAVAPGYNEALANLGVVEAKRGDLERAVVHLERALAVDPDYAAAHENLGAVHEWRGDLERAVWHLEQLVRLEPGNARAHHGLGVLELRRGDPARAEARIREALRLDPGYALAHRNLAALLEARGDREQARAHHAEALRLAPDDAKARR